MSLHIQIEKFEGPLALLLYLIRKEEMDVFDINIHHITQQYLDYIKAMKKLDLEMAGEFVAYAATLIHIKSRMLLPQYDENGEEVDEEDPRRTLVQKLLEYEKFQEASKQLYDRPLLGRDTWVRGQRLKVESEEEDEIIVEENPLFSLIRSYRFVVTTLKNSVHKVLGELQSIAERVHELKDRLIVGQQVIFKDLLSKTEVTTNQVLVTFLSFLELCKLGYVSLYQSEPLSDIHITTKKLIDDYAIEGNDAYDYVATENILENKGSKLEVDLSGEDFESDAPKDEVDESLEVGEPIEAGEGVKEILAINKVETPAEESFIIEAATDDEIEEEEKRLNLYSGPLNEPSGEVDA